MTQNVVKGTQRHPMKLTEQVHEISLTSLLQTCFKGDLRVETMSTTVS